MEKFTKKRLIQKIIISLLIIASANFIVPRRVSAVDWGDVGGTILKEIVQLIDSLGDVVMGAFNNFMLGANGISSAMLKQDNANLNENSQSWLTTNLSQDVVEINKIEKDYKVPNMLYSPENIFGNKIAALDVNFLRQNTFNPIMNTSKAQNGAKSSASYLSKTIATWYRSFRNIAIVGLLSVLVYLGIRILITTAASDKAKYKESLKDWLVALCLVFVIHIIMSGILMLTDKVTDLFADSDNSIFTVKVTDVDGNEKIFNTNLTGLIRIKAQGDKWQDATAYAIIYIVLVIYTGIFTFIYFKRFLWIAFLTMIAPLVALTYPIDKLR